MKKVGAGASPALPPTLEERYARAKRYAELLYAAIENEHISKNALRVLLYLMNRYDPDKGYAAASNESIAAALHLSERTVRSSIQDLRKCGGGFIKRTRRGFHFKRGPYKSAAGGYSHYVPRGFDADGKPGTKPAENYRHKVAGIQ
jgi:biotin operon repressor